ncbi:adenylate/guanylate cyclase domain-containing protein [Candidatus Venteria ishoeyi]|uniref:Adenylate cyclase 2 n=1 Tax=Candidatus Venteria ishoeyi TaxID=1899563 RepID=A0A1H6FAG1_9GAMM|nr:adenylate/guanylate cyclase domain-containing protein [Candidatus Venteria ishoeyi]SEH06361.1 Adenylate cyclase 2 [Candidatus Venteria ishoeyi]
MKTYFIKPGLRKKVIFFSLALALLPLAFSSYSMISITQNELKSAVNDTMIHAAQQSATEIDDIFTRTWRATLQLVANAVDNPDLGVDEKIALLESAIHSLDDFIVLQISVADFPPILIAQNHLQTAYQQAEASKERFTKGKAPTLQARKRLAEVQMAIGDAAFYVDQNPHYLSDADIWLLDLYYPLKNPLSSKPAMLVARINLSHIERIINKQQLNQVGQVYLLNRQGNTLFASQYGKTLTGDITHNVTALLRQQTQAISATPFTSPEGKEMLGAYAVLAHLPWAVVTTLEADKAYLTISDMLRSLLLWFCLGLLVAVLSAIWFSSHLTRPILEIAQVVRPVGEGDFSQRVKHLDSRDEISLLGENVNEMIQGLMEKFHLQKFVSGGTLAAIKQAGQEGVKLGGERRFATVLFSDIRGFTAFSEKVTPETVISMLNTYLRAQAKLVKKHHGDIDKFVGDELIAVFQGEDMVKNAILCACEIHRVIKELNKQQVWDIRVGIGINSGDMVMGAMGSEERMDYTILGDNVNLGARLCSAAQPEVTVISDYAYQAMQDFTEELEQQQITLEALKSIQVKGKIAPIKIYQVICSEKNPVYTSEPEKISWQEPQAVKPHEKNATLKSSQLPPI